MPAETPAAEIIFSCLTIRSLVGSSPTFPKYFIAKQWDGALSPFITPAAPRIKSSAAKEIQYRNVKVAGAETDNAAHPESYGNLPPRRSRTNDLLGGELLA